MSTIFDTTFLSELVPAFERGDPRAADKTAEAANVRLVEALYRMIATSDFDALAAAFAEDVELEILGPGGAPMVGTRRGPADVIDAIRSNFALLQDQYPEVDTVVAQGDTVVVTGRETGRYRATGQPYELQWMHAFTLQDGRLRRIRELFDSTSLTAAARGEAPAGPSPPRS
jgi:ketosteroid isomerase-like protein